MEGRKAVGPGRDSRGSSNLGRTGPGNPKFSANESSLARRRIAILEVCNSLLVCALRSAVQGRDLACSTCTGRHQPRSRNGGPHYRRGTGNEKRETRDDEGWMRCWWGYGREPMCGRAANAYETSRRVKTRVRPRVMLRKNQLEGLYLSPQRAMRCPELEIGARASDRGSSCDERVDTEQAEEPRGPSTTGGFAEWVADGGFRIASSIFGFCSSIGGGARLVDTGGRCDLY
jgi:hypothetical protein